MGSTKRQLEDLTHLFGEPEINPAMFQEPQPFPEAIDESVNPVNFGLEPVKAQEITAGLNTIVSERAILINAYDDIIDLEITPETIPVFKELRLKLVKNRTQGFEKWHKANKEFFLAGGRFVDAIKNKEILINSEMEARLLQGEKYFENIEKERLQKLKEERGAMLGPFVDELPNDLETLESDIFDALFETKKRHYKIIKIAEEQAAKEAAAKAEAEAKAAELQKAENERLKSELAEAKTRAEAIENEAKAKAEAEAKNKAEKDAQILELAKKPIKRQMENWIDRFTAPESGFENETKELILTKFAGFKSWAKSEIEKI